MRRFSFRPTRPYLGLLLLACFCFLATAQTIAPRRGKQAQQHSHPASSGNPSVAVSAGNWSQLAEFSDSKFHVSCCSYFGTGVAISLDTIVISDPWTDPTAAYVFVKPSNGWKNATPVVALTIPGVKFDSTSGSVAIAGDTIVVGGPEAAYVFVKPAGGWTNTNPIATLTSSDGSPLDGFGAAVAISGNTIVVTAPDTNSDTGAAYVFVKPAGGWTNMTQTAKLTASDGQPDDYLGWSASVTGGTVALGGFQYSEPRKAHVFVQPAGGWTDATQTAELTPSDAPSGFGFSIAASGDEVLVGVYSPEKSEAAHIFVKPPGGWVDMTETAKLTPVDPNSYAAFGYAVGVDGKNAVVGSRFRSNGSFIDAGGAYIYTEPPGGWHDMSSATVLTGSDARHNTWFGSALALSDKSLVVGAPWVVFHAAYVFGLP